MADRRTDTRKRGEGAHGGVGKREGNQVVDEFGNRFDIVGEGALPAMAGAPARTVRRSPMAMKADGTDFLSF